MVWSRCFLFPNPNWILTALSAVLVSSNLLFSAWDWDSAHKRSAMRMKGAMNGNDALQLQPPSPSGVFVHTLLTYLLTYLGEHLYHSPSLLILR